MRCAQGGLGSGRLSLQSWEPKLPFPGPSSLGPESLFVLDI